MKLIDLREFYLSNVSEEEYYYQFYELVRDVNMVHDIFSGYEERNDYKFEVFNLQAAIDEFRLICQPGYENINIHKKEDCWFYVILFYLSKNYYQIKEFPNLINNPPLSPYQFIYNDIRNKLLFEGKDDNGKVTYNERRKLIESLSFVKSEQHIEIEHDIEKKFQEISNREASFQEMSTNERLAEIINLIENMLKSKGSYIKLDYSKECLGYINDEIIVEYKRNMQCFRHSSSEAISQRDSYSDAQKKFFINFGIVILEGIKISLESSKDNAL